MTIYDRIKKRREELGLSQQDLAERVGFKSRSSVNKIELGQRDITRGRVEDFATALYTSPEYLMGWNDDNDSKDKSADEFAAMFKNGELSDTDIRFILALAQATPEQAQLLELLVAATPGQVQRILDFARGVLSSK